MSQPKTCPRCGGLVLEERQAYEVVPCLRCLLCGWYRVPVFTEQPAVERTSAEAVKVAANMRYRRERWEKGLCTHCDEPRLSRLTIGRKCLQKRKLAGQAAWRKRTVHA